MITQPAFVDGLVQSTQFLTPAKQVMSPASENFGKAVQSLLMMFLITRVNWRYLFYIALSVLIIGNFVCTLVSSFEAFSHHPVFHRNGYGHHCAFMLCGWLA